MKQLAPIIIVITACVALAVPSLAGARAAGRTFEATYPFAAKLCAKADADKLPPPLAAARADVLADCAALKSSFTAAQATYTAATDPLPAKAQAVIAAAKATCDTAGKHTDACRTARQEARTKLRAIRDEAKAARRTYVAAVQLGRKTFWGAIKQLKGGSAVSTDTSEGTGAATPAPPVVPGDAAVA